MRGHGFFQRHVEVVDVVQHLEDRGEDARTARCTEHQADLAVTRDDARAHGGQHTLAWLDGIGVATDHTEGIGDARLGTEVVHFVVEQEAGALDHHTAAVIQVEGVGVADRVAIGIDDGKVSRLPWLEARAHLLGLGDGRWIDLGRALLQVIRRCQLRDRYVGVVRVTQVVGTVGKHALFDLRQQVDVTRRIQLDTLEVGGALLLHPDQLRQSDAAGAGQRRGIEAVALPVDTHRLAPFDAVGGQVLLADQPVVTLHLGHQQVCGLAFVEIIRPLVGDALQGLGQLRLAEGGTGLHGAEVILEIGRTLEQAEGIVAVLVLLVGHREAFTGIAHRRGDELAPGQLAEALVCLPHAQHGAGHAGGPGADQAQVLDHLALVVEVHGLAGGLGRDFPVIQKVRLALDIQRHEATAADIARLGVGDGQGEGGRHRGIHRIAAGLEHLSGHLGAVLIRSCDRPAFQNRAVGDVARGNDRHGKGQSADLKQTHRAHPYCCGHRRPAMAGAVITNIDNGDEA